MVDAYAPLGELDAVETQRLDDARLLAVLDEGAHRVLLHILRVVLVDQVGEAEARVDDAVDAARHADGGYVAHLAEQVVEVLEGDARVQVGHVDGAAYLLALDLVELAGQARIGGQRSVAQRRVDRVYVGGGRRRARHGDHAVDDRVWPRHTARYEHHVGAERRTVAQRLDLAGYLVRIVKRRRA